MDRHYSGAPTDEADNERRKLLRKFAVDVKPETRKENPNPEIIAKLQDKFVTDTNKGADRAK